MLDKRLKLMPKNKEGLAHGLWYMQWYDGAWFKGHYINNVETGYFQADWIGTGNVEKEYYVR